MSKKDKNSKSNHLQKYNSMFSNFRKRSPKWKLFVYGTIIIIGIIAGLVVGLWPSNAATTAQKGDTVLVDYTGTMDDGTVFDSTVNESFEHVTPLQFTIGDGQMVPGFDRGVIGMSVNETRKIHVAPEDGYGPQYFEVNLADLPENVQVGESLYKQDAYGKNIRATVINISESSATLENTAEMAGEDLNFEITLVELIKATGQSSSNTSN